MFHRPKHIEKVIFLVLRMVLQILLTMTYKKALYVFFKLLSKTEPCDALWLTADDQREIIIICSNWLAGLLIEKY